MRWKAGPKSGDASNPCQLPTENTSLPGQIHYHHHHHHHHHHYHHQSLNREGRWGATDDFATSFFPFCPVFHCLWELITFHREHSCLWELLTFHRKLSCLWKLITFHRELSCLWELITPFTQRTFLSLGVITFHREHFCLWGVVTFHREHSCLCRPQNKHIPQPNPPLNVSPEQTSLFFGVCAARNTRKMLTYKSC